MVLVNCRITDNFVRRIAFFRTILCYLLRIFENLKECRKEVRFSNINMIHCSVSISIPKLLSITLPNFSLALLPHKNRTASWANLITATEFLIQWITSFVKGSRAFSIQRLTPYENLLTMDTVNQECTVIISSSDKKIKTIIEKATYLLIP